MTSTMTMIRAEPWAPHAAAATESASDPQNRRYTTTANGTLSCCGGWQFVYGGVASGHRYRISWEGVWRDLAEPLDALVGHVYWGDIATDCYAPGTATVWDYVCAEIDEGIARFSAQLIAPEGVSVVTVRNSLRWTAGGSVVMSEPTVLDLGAHQQRAPVRVAVATGTEASCREPRADVQQCVDHYLGLAQQACQQEGAELVALPEICLQWRVPGHPYDGAVEVPGPETDGFADLARAHDAVIVVGLHERCGHAVYNSAVVIDADGSIAGIYHKVHLASTEALNGILPGDGFPVMETGVGRVGSTICMDSSAAESARMIGLNGAEFLVLPIMGDHRASTWHLGPPEFDEERWRCIQRTRAMDNQLCMVVARNMGRGSCIIDRSGEVLAYNDGNQELVVADVALDDGFRKWNGGCFRQVNWRQRRPHLYGAYASDDPAATRILRA